MKPEKKVRLENRGWKVGSTAEILGLDRAEQALEEIKLALSRSLSRQRAKLGLTQTEAARLLRSSQSRVAKMEAGDPSVSLDLLIRSLITLGASDRELCKIIATPRAA